jgi:aminomethyltransferase
LADGPGVIRSHCDIYDGDQVVGQTSSGGYSPMLSTSIAMAYLPKDRNEVGHRFEVDLRGRRLPCHVVKRPFYSAGRG